MWFPSWLRSLSRRGKNSRQTRPPRRVPYRPALEGLEHRNLLSTLLVTNILDTGVSGDGSLRGEIAAADNGDKITFAHNLAGQTIALTSGNELLIDKSLNIDGLGADKLTISGDNTTNPTRVFEIAAGATVTISHLTIANGNADGGDGSGIFNGGTL